MQNAQTQTLDVIFPVYFSVFTSVELFKIIKLFPLVNLLFSGEFPNSNGLKAIIAIFFLFNFLSTYGSKFKTNNVYFYSDSRNETRVCRPIADMKLVFKRPWERSIKLPLQSYCARGCMLQQITSKFIAIFFFFWVPFYPMFAVVTNHCARSCCIRPRVIFVLLFFLWISCAQFNDSL